MSGAPQSVATWLAGARAAIEALGLPGAAGDARLLLTAATGLSLTDIVAGGDLRILSPAEMSRLDAMLERRLRREPVHRIIGRREFFGLTLELSSETLEPRPDTEILVEAVLARLPAIIGRNPAPKLLDLGTGTGAIALALLSHCPRATALAVDISEDALATARRNADINGLASRFEALNSHWFEAVHGRFDIIVSNPPYIKHHAIADLDPEVRVFDPPAALDGGLDGLDAYRSIALGAAEHLLPGGLVAVEIGFDQHDDVSSVFSAQGMQRIEGLKDLAGNDRVLLFMQ